MSLSRVGVWGPGTWLADSERAGLRSFGAHLEDLGFTSLWMSAGFGDGVPSAFGDVLDATTTLKVATGILSIWHSSAAQTAQAVTDLQERHPGRFTVGLGASHERFVSGPDRTYTKPYSEMVRYLDELDRLGSPASARMLAALGPRMIALAGERSAGAHPYFVPVEHTRIARAALGPGARLVPEVTVALETDPARARALAREFMSLYLALPNYTNNLVRLGFTPDDISDGGSDRLVDAIVGWGDAGEVATRVNEHLEAGADEVLIQVLHSGDQLLPAAQVAVIARALDAG